MTTPNFIYSTVYVKHPLLLKEKLHLWDYSQELWGHMNDDQLGGLWYQLFKNPPGRLLVTVLEAMIRSDGG